MPTRLNTNSVGFDILVNRLGLAYDEVEVCFGENQFDSDSKQLHDRYWSLNKLYAYSLQNEPFIHFDNDVFFFRKLDRAWVDAALVAQNEEMELPYYTASLELIHKYFAHIPVYLDVEPSSVLAVNAGIAGGGNYGFFKDLYAEVTEFLVSNSQHLDLLPDAYVNIFIEQCVMKNYACSRQISFKYVLPNIINSSKKYRVNDFHLLSNGVDYIHVMNYKSNPTICESIARMLYLFDKEMYHHCIYVADSLVDSKSKPIERKKPSNDLSFALAYFFQRTKNVCKQLLVSDLCFDSVTKLNRSILLIEGDVSCDQYQLIEDVFMFELLRYRFFEEIECDHSIRMYHDFVRMKKILMCNKLEDCIISIAEYSKLIETRWNWIECSEFMDIPDKQYLGNTKCNPGRFEVLVMYYPEQKAPKEYLLDVADSIIIKLAKEPIVVGKLVTKASVLLEREGCRISDKSLIDRVLFLLFHCVLGIKEKSYRVI